MFQMTTGPQQGKNFGLNSVYLMVMSSESGRKLKDQERRHADNGGPGKLLMAPEVTGLKLRKKSNSTSQHLNTTKENSINPLFFLPSQPPKGRRVELKT